MGWMMLPLIVLLSSVVGATFGLFMIALKGHQRDRPIPFGPFLAAAGLIALLLGQPIVNNWLAPF
jgi:leader peptidase (prepilin peptidase)/N-methyltransferase